MKETNIKETQWESYENMRKRVEAEDAKKKEKTKGKKIKVVYAEPADYIPEDLRREYKLGEFAELSKEELRFRNTLLEYVHEIEYCKEVLASGVTGDLKEDYERRLEEAEECKKKMLQDKDKFLRNKK